MERMTVGGAGERRQTVAWVTAHPSGRATPEVAVVEIDCTPERSSEVADVLADDPGAATTKLTSGARDVLVLAQAPDLWTRSSAASCTPAPRPDPATPPPCSPPTTASSGR